ncbi:hypothetical protein M433DRAFT_110466 [Acidomyces richmondensis BFW]|nr:MAG: hypothetical protein FE78DRAFT_163517 [Acidomyces sp. 'richmondensis']KYG44292.1 hypothetical protein M433DRAFT_110466 [Acidomyces richmondensis BFW]
MKTGFSSLDVRVIAHELSKSLVTLRLANIYDLSTRIFLLKFAKPNHREQLLIDSGFRCHLTSFARATAAAPSPFVAKLRKFLRTRRVTKIEQVGTDRVIEIQFSDGTYRLFLEFYAGGNIVLTDTDLTILALLRNVDEGAEHEQYRVGLRYDLTLRQNFGGVPPLTKERIRDGLQKVLHRQQEDAKRPGKKTKKKGGDELRKALAVTTTEFPPVLIDHALEVSGYDRQTLPEAVIANEHLMDNLLSSLKEAQRMVTDITSANILKGYILAKASTPPPRADENGETGGGLIYDDFHPFKPAHLVKDNSIVLIEIDGFNQTVDQFFSSLEGQKLESRLQERENNAMKRIDAARQEQAKRIEGLQQVQQQNIRKAQAIEANIERVEEAIAAVNGLIAQGMDWIDIGRLIESEQARNNAVAEIIKMPLKLHENIITLLLSEYDGLEEEEFVDETDSEGSETENDEHASTKPGKAVDRRLEVDINLSLSAYANVREYYVQRRSAAEKQERTAKASERALKSTEQKVMADLKKGLRQEKELLRPIRKQMWFEKFIYFISSDGYLVLAGRDAQQNEILYRRYLRKGDVYVHADLHGAASVIIKNNPKTPEAPIPPSTLSQAGTLAVCTSSAWESKAVMSAWYVNSDQVSKTAPTGEYLTTGGFMIRGKKQFLPPAQLLLGFAIMFRISEESKARHVKHRLQINDTPLLATPGLTDAETAAESSIAGADDKEDEDDEFPDAHPGPVIVDEGDEKTGAKQVPDSEEDEFPDVHVNGSTASGDEDEDPALGKEAQEQIHDNTERREMASMTQTTRATSARERKEHRRAQSEAASKQKPGHPLRGKKGKAKKIAQKYANQDEEDREIAMQLLGSRAAADRHDAEDAFRRARGETAEEARARRQAQHEKAQRKGLEAEEIRRLNLEEGVDDLGEDELTHLTRLDDLVGTPLPGDEILEAIPVCAPWLALTKYKYKVKMQPGQQKKGKALREILNKWTKDASDAKKLDQQSHDTERMWPREVELLKGLKEAEIVGIIPVKQVRLMMSGGSGSGDRAKGGGNVKGAKGGRGKGSKKVR